MHKFKELQHFGFGMFTVLLSGCSGIFNLFVYCLFGQLATENYFDMANCVYESNWQELPNEYQKYLVLIISNAQIESNYHGFGMIYLNLDTFTKVRRI